MQPPLNLRHLHAVAQAVRKNNTRLAAEAVHLSQPAATQAIRKLENLVGAALFERSNIGLCPTEAGKKLALRVERAFAKLEEARRLLSGKLPPLEYIATSIQLRAVVAVEAHKNYSLAARSLGVSQPSVHRAVGNFQRLCGQTLFRATPQGLEPTAVAREVARCMSLALAEINKGVEDVREAVGVVDGQVWVGCLPLARTDLLPDAITIVLQQFPDVRMRVVDGAYDELLRALRYGKIDVVIGALRSPAPTFDIEQEPLFLDPLSIVVRSGHPLLKVAPIKFAQLAILDWIVPPTGTPTRNQFQALFESRGLAQPKHIVECSSLIVTRGLLQRSDRVGILSTTQVRQEVQSGQLCVLPLPLPGTERPIGLTTRKNWQPTMAMSRFIEMFRKVVDGR